MTEDPATGSAAGPLAVHLLRYSKIDSGETIKILQGEKVNRPSTLYAEATGTENNIETVNVGGSAVVIGHGKIQI